MSSGLFLVDPLERSDQSLVHLDKMINFFLLKKEIEFKSEGQAERLEQEIQFKTSYQIRINYTNFKILF